MTAMPLSVPADILAEFHTSDAEAVRRKLRRFAKDGPEKLHIVSDFDLTLTAGKQAGQNLGTWDVMDELMPPEGVVRHTAIYQSFRPIEIQGKLTDKIASEKWAETLDLITSYHMRIDDVEAAFLAVATLRDGAKEIFKVCESAGIPTVILSSGIRNVIELMAAYYDLHPTYVLSNDLEIDATDRRVIGWRRDTLVHILNKNERGHDKLSTLRSTRPNVVLFGDVADDTKMVAGDNVLRIRVLDPRKGETDALEGALQNSYDAGYDLVTEHSLHPAARIIDWLRSV